MTSKDGLAGALVSATEGRVQDLVLLAATLPEEAAHLVPINILLQNKALTVEAYEWALLVVILLHRVKLSVPPRTTLLRWLVAEGRSRLGKAGLDASHLVRRRSPEQIKGILEVSADLTTLTIDSMAGSPEITRLILGSSDTHSPIDSGSLSEEQWAGLGRMTMAPSTVIAKVRAALRIKRPVTAQLLAALPLEGVAVNVDKAGDLGRVLKALAAYAGVGVKSVASDNPHSFLKSIIDQAAVWWQRSGVRESDLKDAIKECLLK